MQSIKPTLLISFLALLYCSSKLFSQENVETFSPPIPTEMVSPRFPQNELNRNEEGAVEIVFMVDLDGKPFDPIVSYTIGKESFQRVALRALNSSEFDPASFNGEPIIGSSVFRYSFTIEKDDYTDARATSPFAHRYRQFNRAMDTEEQNEIQIRLTKLEEQGSKNFYEDAYLNLARYLFASRFGSLEEQMFALHGTLSFSNSIDDYVYFDDDTVLGMRRELLRLHIQTQYYSEALDTYSLMKDNQDHEGIAMYTNAIDMVKNIEFDDSAYGLNINLKENGTAWFNLFKHHFYFTGGQGEFVEIKLWCDQQHLSFSLERDFNYDIPAEWGRCQTQIIGDPYATATLVQN